MVHLVQGETLQILKNQSATVKTSTFLKMWLWKRRHAWKHKSGNDKPNRKIVKTQNKNLRRAKDKQDGVAGGGYPTTFYSGSEASLDGPQP